PQKLQQIKENPQADDILSRLLKTPFPPSVGFGMDRLGVNVGGFLVGAVGTTSQAGAQALDVLLERPVPPAGAKEAAGKGGGGRLEGYVWEAMRFNPIFPYLARLSAQESPLARGTDRETTIPAGTVVLSLTRSAMFDADEFSHPEEFQPRRPYY